jgi:hypothetical protein
MAAAGESDWAVYSHRASVKPRELGNSIDLTGVLTTNQRLFKRQGQRSETQSLTETACLLAWGGRPLECEPGAHVDTTAVQFEPNSDSAGAEVFDPWSMYIRTVGLSIHDGLSSCFAFSS